MLPSIKPLASSQNFMSNGLTFKILREISRVVTTWMENSVCKISWKLVENWLRNPRKSIILVDEFNVNLTIVIRNFVSISSLTDKCAAQKFKNFYSSSLLTCLHHMVILRSQNKITDFLMILAWDWTFKIDQPESHDFRKFLRKFWTVSLKFCRGHFLLKSYKIGWELTGKSAKFNNPGWWI